MTPSRLALLLALPALAGCAEGTSDSQLVGIDDAVATAAMEPEAAYGVEPAVDRLAWVPLRPRVDAFDVEPSALPLGGGPVLVTWSASDVAGCAVVIDDEPALRGLEGELMIDVEEDADVRLVCLDDAQALVAAARTTVTVVQPPVDGFRPDESVTVGTWQSVELLGRASEVGEVHEVAITLPEDGRVVVDVSAAPARAQFEIWLAADADGDRALSSAEVLQVSASNGLARIDQVLPAGVYSLFVVSLSGAADWHVQVSATDPDSDGSNF